MYSIIDPPPHKSHLQAEEDFILACADLMDNVLLQRLDLLFGKHVATLIICW
jgi:hypothetical protein